MKSKNKNKLLKYILVFIIIIFIIILIIKGMEKVEANKPDVKIGSTDENVIEVSPIYEKEEKKEVYPKKSYEFIMKYNKIGKLNLNDMYKKIYLLKNEVQRIFLETQKLNNSQLENYYEENKIKLNEIIDFSEKQNFMDFVEKSKNMKKTDFIYAEFDLESFEDIVEDYIKCNLILYYSDDYNISFNMFLAKKELGSNEQKYIFRVN